ATARLTEALGGPLTGAQTSTPDVLLLESNIPAGVAHSGTCNPPGQTSPWPFDAQGVAAALPRNDALRVALHVGPAGQGIAAIVDSGLDMASGFRDTAFAPSGDIPGDGVDNDADDFVDNRIGVNIYSRKEPTAFPAIQDGEHGTHMAGIARGTPSFAGRQ